MFDDRNIQFRFVTRTKFKDYRVFYNGGGDTLSNREGFRPLRQFAYVEEGRPCAALFERSGKIYLLASSLSRGKVDERGRGITFSFCWIFQAINYRQRARYAFIRLIDHWEEAEDWLNENLHDINEGLESEGVELDESAFVKWLLADFRVNNEAKFKVVYSDKISLDSFRANYAWPKDGNIFRYDRNDDFIENVPIGQEEDITSPESFHTEKSPRTRAKDILAGLGAGTLIGAALTGAIMWNCFIVGPRENVSELENEVKKMQEAVANKQAEIDNMQISSDEIRIISAHFTTRLTGILDKYKYSFDVRSKDYFSRDIEDYMHNIITSVDEAIKQ